MIKITNKVLNDLKNGVLTEDAFASALAEKYPAKEIALAFAELLSIKDSSIKQVAKIPITKEAFEAHFRMVGESKRGRKKKDE